MIRFLKGIFARREMPGVGPKFGISILVRRFPSIKAAKTSGRGPAILLQQDGQATEKTIFELRETFPCCWIDLVGAEARGRLSHPSALLANSVVSFDRLSIDPILNANGLGPVAKTTVRRGYDLILLAKHPSDRGDATTSVTQLQQDFLNEGGVLVIGDNYLFQATTPNTIEARRGGKT